MNWNSSFFVSGGLEVYSYVLRFLRSRKAGRAGEATAPVPFEHCGLQAKFLADSVNESKLGDRLILLAKIAWSL